MTTNRIPNVVTSVSIKVIKVYRTEGNRNLNSTKPDPFVISSHIYSLWIDDIKLLKHFL